MPIGQVSRERGNAGRLVRPPSGRNRLSVPTVQSSPPLEIDRLREPDRLRVMSVPARGSLGSSREKEKARRATCSSRAAETFRMPHKALIEANGRRLIPEMPFRSFEDEATLLRISRSNPRELSSVVDRARRRV